MTRLPTVPDDWLWPAPQDGNRDPELFGSGPNPDGSLSISGALQDAASQPLNSTGLSVLMDPKDIATVPGLAVHYYGEGNTEPGAVDSASWTPPGNAPDPAAAKPSADEQSQPTDKYKQGADSVGIFGHVMDGWNVQNHALGLHSLGKYVERAEHVLAPLQNGLEAAGEIAKGAPKLPTLLGAGGKTAADLGASGLGGLVGGLAVPPPFTPLGSAVGSVIGGLISDYGLGKTSNQQVGEAIQRLPAEAGRSYSTYVLNNPYYDPRLAAVP